MLPLAENMNFLEKLTFGLQITGIGMGTVFIVLILLYILIIIMGKVFQYIEKRDAGVKTADEMQQATVDKVKSTQDLQEDLTIIAVLTAAISSVTGKNISQFKIRSFRKIK